MIYRNKLNIKNKPNYKQREPEQMKFKKDNINKKCLVTGGLLGQGRVMPMRQNNAGRKTWS